jgi:signal transduction histidine kinase
MPDPQTDLSTLNVQYMEWIRLIQAGEYDQLREVSPKGGDPILAELLVLSQRIEQREAQHKYLANITSQANQGLYLEEILENIYRDFKSLIPYNRIGFSIIDEAKYTVKAIWANSDQSKQYLKKGYSASLHGSSLENILISGKPRIINNLEEYLSEKPASNSTRLIVSEGMRSSLTCPLTTQGKGVGFIFFSSTLPNTYTQNHVNIFQEIANQLSVMLEKGQLVSELAEKQKETAVLNAELIKLNKIKNDFLAIAAHDLRNPMSYIQLASSLLFEPAEKHLDPEFQQIIRDIHKNAEFINVLLNDLLDIALFESGSFTLNPTSIPISVFLEDTVNYHDGLAARKNSKVKLDKIQEGMVYADPLRLRQVLDNLISNAIKFSPAGSIIWLRANHLSGGWRIEVEDLGPGISEIDRQHLFTEFTRLTAKPTAGEKSTGLGLAISYRIVEAHGGKIGVEENKVNGSTFWFALPDLASPTLLPADQIDAPEDPPIYESS